MTDSLPSVDSALPPRSRRAFLRGGAVAAATAGVAAVAAAVPTPAHAADGDHVELGEENTSETATTITLGDTTGGPEPTLALENASGPSLYLQPLNPEIAPSLGLGQLVNTDYGPLIGVDYGLGGGSNGVPGHRDRPGRHPDTARAGHSDSAPRHPHRGEP